MKRKIIEDRSREKSRYAVSTSTSLPTDVDLINKQSILIDLCSSVSKKPRISLRTTLKTKSALDPDWRKNIRKPDAIHPLRSTGSSSNKAKVGDHVDSTSDSYQFAGGLNDDDTFEERPPLEDFKTKLVSAIRRDSARKNEVSISTPIFFLSALLCLTVHR